MGDLGQSLNCRKRKADSDDDCQDSQPVVQDKNTKDTMLVDPAIPPHPFPNAPRLPPSSPWLSTDTSHAVWPSEPSPTDTATPVSPLSPHDPSQDASPRFNKRPRLESREASPSVQRRSPPRLAFPPRGLSPRNNRRSRRLDARDPSIVPSPHPGPPNPSSLRIEGSCPATDLQHSPLPPGLPPIDLNSSHIPALHPLINRQTLKELDLSAIMRNPQLRHDLLFDAGLQFRPTSGRRKRDLADRYWRAIVQELENGCTCVSFDMQGKPHDCVCVCRRVPIPPHNPVLTFSSSRRVLTLRMPSRIRPLLAEFLEVLLSVIQPLSTISGPYANPDAFQNQIQQHAAQATHLRSLFDPELIEQELQHELFDPSGLFRMIGQTLKSHCAPMRDRAVDMMVEVAQSCAPGCGGSKKDAVKAVRMCLDILELMKLDIANHQLQTLRPFLIDTSGQFELKTFKGRKGPGSTLHVTQQWLQAAHKQLMASGRISHPSFPSGSLNYRNLCNTQQAYLSVLKGLTDLVFNPPSSIGPILTPPTHPSHNSHAPISPLPNYPETSYLDSARLLVLAADAADTTVLYMFLLLYRQLVFSDPSSSPNAPRDLSKVSDAELVKLKKEIRDVSSTHLGYCLVCRRPEEGDSSNAEKPEDKEWEKWKKLEQDIVLQVAMRAKEAQTPKPQSTCLVSPSTERPPLGLAPDERILKLAERWSDTHMQPGSALSGMLRNRIRDAVFNHVVALTFPARESSSGKCKALDFAASLAAVTNTNAQLGTVSGMEPLTDEIRSLAERLSRLAMIHLGVYLPLYEQEGFLTTLTPTS